MQFQLSIQVQSHWRKQVDSMKQKIWISTTTGESKQNTSRTCKIWREGNEQVYRKKIRAYIACSCTVLFSLWGCRSRVRQHCALSMWGDGCLRWWDRIKIKLRVASHRLQEGRWRGVEPEKGNSWVSAPEQNNHCLNTARPAPRRDRGCIQFDTMPLFVIWIFCTRFKKFGWLWFLMNDSQHASSWPDWISIVTVYCMW